MSASSPLIAQIDTETTAVEKNLGKKLKPAKKVLAFTNNKTNKAKFTKVGRKMHYVLKSDTTVTYKGKLEAINENSIVIDGKEIGFDEFEHIKARLFTNPALIVLSTVVMIGTTVVLVFATIYGLYFASEYGGGGGAVSLGAVALFGGYGAAIGMIVKKKKFDMDKWTLSVGELR